MRRAVEIEVYGLVQGIGYRPFVAEKAAEYRLDGSVRNAGGRVYVEAEGEREDVRRFIDRLGQTCPEGGRIDGTVVKEKEPGAIKPGFFITESMGAFEEIRFLPPDLATCPACERELFTPGNRRYRHPFISCVSCGPRYSILKEVPYDRAHLTMDPFPLCEDCAKEYERIGDRRRYAQTICCPSCGPKVRSITREGEFTEAAALSETEKVLLSGGIAAVKGIGGFHLTCLPEREEAVERLNELKGREGKPYALMFRDLQGIEALCRVSEKERELLSSPARPIVLLEKKTDLPGSVFQMSDRIGAFLPSHPIQHLLLEKCKCLIMTSANPKDRPIIYKEEDLLPFLEAGQLDLILTHDREILGPLDDSIFQVTRAGSEDVVQVIRRARGIVPTPVVLKKELSEPVLAKGGDLKNTFALGKGRAVYLSQHFGDLAEREAEKARDAELTRMKTLFAFPEEMKTVADLHPGYLSSEGVKHRVQHHHAHILSVMAEHGLEEKVLGLAFDGTGYGTDGTVWGSEFLLCEGKSFTKKGSLLPVLLPGTDRSMKDAKQSLAGYLSVAGEKLSGEDEVFCRALYNGSFGVYNASMGRLFDAASAALRVCSYNSYEGKCAALLEETAARAKTPFALELPLVEKDGLLYGNGPLLIRDLVSALAKGAPKEELALGFHEAVAAFAIKTGERIASENNVKTICLSGGSFVNRILMRRLITGFREKGFTVYWNSLVPPGDGGISLGQIYYEAVE